MKSAGGRRRLLFADIELEPDNFVLRRRGVPIKLAPQPFKLLVFLASQSGQLVTRDELRRVLWPQDVTVDFEHGLNTCIRQIRTALGDNSETGRIIETIPRVGYRMRVTVTHVDGAVPVPRRWGVAVLVAIGIVAATAWVGFPGRAQRTAPPSPMTQELLTRARVALESRTTAGTSLARILFERAATTDPASVDAVAGVAATYLAHPAALTGVDPRIGRSIATDAVRRALALSPSSPSPHLALAALKRAEGDWQGADAEHRRAVEVAPDSAEAHRAYAGTLALEGNFTAAIAAARRAVALDAWAAENRSTLAIVLRFARHYEEAMAEAKKALEIDPTYGPAYHTLAQCEEALGQLDLAITHYERTGQPSGNLGHAYAVAGRIDEARALLEQFERQYVKNGTSAGEIAQIYVGLGDADRAFEWLTRGAERGAMLTLKVADVWDPLRSDPRFVILLRTTGLMKSPPVLAPPVNAPAK